VTGLSSSQRKLARRTLFGLLAILLAEPARAFMIGGVARGGAAPLTTDDGSAILTTDDGTQNLFVG
jgi:hypothetical protein